MMMFMAGMGNERGFWFFFAKLLCVFIFVFRGKSGGGGSHNILAKKVFGELGGMILPFQLIPAFSVLFVPWGWG